MTRPRDHFFRACLFACKAKGDLERAVLLAEGANDAPAIAILRSAITPDGVDTASALVVERALQDVLQSVRAAQIIGRMPEIRRVPFEQKLGTANTFTTAQWVQMGAPAPVVSIPFGDIALSILKVSTIAVFSQELLRLSSAAEVVGQELIAAAARAADEAFIDPANSGSAGVKPAAVTSGAPTIASSGDPIADLRSLVDSFDGDPLTSYIVTNPRVALHLATFTDSAGAIVFPDATATGGSVAGLRLLTSAASPADSSGAGSLALIDAAGIAVAEEAPQIGSSTEATVAMENPASTPDATTSMTSLWHANLAGIMCTQRINWGIARPGSVIAISDANY